MKRRAFLITTTSGAAASVAAAIVRVNWPHKPIRLIVPFAPGGSSEIIARAIAVELPSLLQQTVLVENKPGGSGNIAMQECLIEGDDEHTLVLGHIGTLAVNPFVFARLPFDVNRDFAPVSLIAKVPTLYVVQARLGVSGLPEFLKLVRRMPDQLAYGSAGSGSAGHLGMEYLKSEAGVRIKHVPYRGTGSQIADLLAGRLDAACVGAAAVLQFIKAGKLQCIATGTKDRLGQLPEVPTVAQQGFPGFEMTQWYGLLAPAAMRDSYVQQLADAVAQVVRSPGIQARFAAEAVQPIGDGPGQFRQFIASEQARWKKVVQKANIRLE